MKMTIYDALEDVNEGILDEILRHKWLESEKAGKNVGMQHAGDEWFAYHFPAWIAHQKNLIFCS
jgi:hypothetical protein